MSAVRRNGWWVAGVVLFGAGVAVSAPNWLRVALAAIGFCCFLAYVWVGIRQPPDRERARSLEPWSPHTKRSIYAVLVVGGIISAGYLLAAITGHGGLGQTYSAAQLDSGQHEFGNANVALIGAIGFYMCGGLALFALPWMPRDLGFRPGPAVTTFAAYNAVGVAGYLIGRAMFA